MAVSYRIIQKQPLQTTRSKKKKCVDSNFSVRSFHSLSSSCGPHESVPKWINFRERWQPLTSCALLSLCKIRCSLPQLFGFYFSSYGGKLCWEREERRNIKHTESKWIRGALCHETMTRSEWFHKLQGMNDSELFRRQAVSAGPRRDGMHSFTTSQDTVLYEVAE